jgi:retron-type reverse transcriptase
MNQQQIIEKVHGLKTKMDLLNLLNALKREDLGKDCYRLTMNQINFYCNPNRNPNKRYKDFTIPKKSGGVRKISAPMGSLKSILTYLNVIFQAMYEPTEAAMGFVPGRSIAANAAIHVGRNYVFNTDLKDFFPSVHQGRIWKMLQLKPFSLNAELASVIAGLCCMQHPDGLTDKNGKIIGVLPQGSPCSPILTNIVCRNLDRKLLGLARRFNLKYSRYADDITFSSDYNVFQEGSEFMLEFARIVAEQKFEINDKKTRLQKSGQRQEVTGLLVNKKVNIAKEYSRDIRSLLYIWQRYGQEQAYSKFCIRYKASKSYQRKKNHMPNMQAVISGKLLYMKMVVGENSSAYISLRDKFMALCPEQSSTLDTNLNYLVSYRLDEFEKSFNTHVEFAYKTKDEVSGRSKTMGSFMLGGEKHVVAVNIRCDSFVDKYLSSPSDNVKETLKKRLYITLSERGFERFWLITIDRMNNAHSRSFKETYKPKLRIEVKKENEEVLDESDANLGVFDYDVFPIDVDLDELLSNFVKSDFDVNILKTWDKIKKI